MDLSFYWFAIHAGHSPVTRANVSTNNSILSACVVFRMQSVLQPHLIILSSSGGTTCLINLIGVIPCLVSCQPILRDPARPISTLVSDEVGPKASTLTECYVCPDIFS